MLIHMRFQSIAAGKLPTTLHSWDRLHAGYIGEFEYVDDHRAGKIVVELNGR